MMTGQYQFDFDGVIIPNQPKKKKPLLYKKSLTWLRTECPYCKAINPDSRDKWGTHKYNSLPSYYCRDCGMEFDGEVEILTKDYEECQQLGLRGAVYKDEKGKWRQSEEVKIS